MLGGEGNNCWIWKGLEDQFLTRVSPLFTTKGFAKCWFTEANLEEDDVTERKAVIISLDIMNVSKTIPKNWIRN